MRRIPIVYKASPNYIHREIAKVDVLVSVGAGVADFNGYIELNSTASVLWDCLRDGATLEELEGVLLETFDVDSDTAKSDVMEFLNQLLEHNMVTEV